MDPLVGRFGIRIGEICVVTRRFHPCGSIKFPLLHTNFLSFSLSLFRLSYAPARSLRISSSTSPGKIWFYFVVRAFVLSSVQQFAVWHNSPGNRIVIKLLRVLVCLVGCRVYAYLGAMGFTHRRDPIAGFNPLSDSVVGSTVSSHCPYVHIHQNYWIV